MIRPFGSSPAGSPAVSRTFLDQRSLADQAVETTRVDIRAELGRLTDYSLARAEHQPAVFGHRRRQSLELQSPLVGTEVKQDVAAQYDVETARVRRVVVLMSDPATV